MSLETETTLVESAVLEPTAEEEIIADLYERIMVMINPVGEDYLTSLRKRALDIVGSVILLPVAVGAILVSAMIIKLEDGGPVFVRLEVPGRRGNKFRMFKLRTLTNCDHVNNKRGADIVFSDRKKLKTTKVGKKLREWSVDELPQLFNIFKGEMSLIGHRPMFDCKVRALGEIPELGDVYENWIKKIVLSNPGAASLPTARGRKYLDESVRGIRRRLRYEYFYIDHASLGFDLKIWVETIQAALARQGSY